MKFEYSIANHFWLCLYVIYCDVFLHYNNALQQIHNTLTDSCNSLQYIATNIYDSVVNFFCVNQCSKSCTILFGP